MFINSVLYFTVKLTLNGSVEKIQPKGIAMEQINITADDFLVTVPHGEPKAWADQFEGDIPPEAAVARWAELGQTLTRRPSPALVAAALVERLEPVAGRRELAALRWLAAELRRAS